MNTPPFSRVVVDAAAKGLPFTGGLLERLGGEVAVEPWTDGQEPPKGRGTLFVTVERGTFLKECPCSPGAVRCGYRVFSPVLQCPYACTYCFLRFYAPEAPLTAYANLEAAEAEFDRAAAGWDGPVRIGTGEFADSLALDPWTGHARWLHGLVRSRPGVHLELKTKSTAVAGLLELSPLPNLVTAWSVNPAPWVVREELGTPPLAERLRAAGQAAAAGHRIAFHLDPIVATSGWERAYSDLVDALFSAVPMEQVAWISLGTLRFPPRFLERWGRALRGRSAYFAEFAAGPDGKLRYFWPLRTRIYRSLGELIRRRGYPTSRVYLCMETPEMWRRVMGKVPEEAALGRALCEGGAG